MVAASYPFLDVLWSMVIFFAFMIWIWLLITVFADVFRRRDIGGGMKAIWIIFVILLPYLGVLIYLIAEHNGMADRSEAQMQQIKAQQDDYIKSVAEQLARRPDRAGEVAARQRRDQPGRVRRPQGEGARLELAVRSGAVAVAVPPQPRRNCDALVMAGTIVIGFDDSDGAERALDRAIAEAKSSGDTLVVVAVLEMLFDPEGPQNFGSLGEMPPMMPLVEPPELEPIFAKARARIDAARTSQPTTSGRSATRPTRSPRRHATATPGWSSSPPVTTASSAGCSAPTVAAEVERELGDGVVVVVD